MAGRDRDGDGVCSLWPPGLSSLVERSSSSLESPVRVRRLSGVMDNDENIDAHCVLRVVGARAGDTEFVDIPRTPGLK